MSLPHRMLRCALRCLALMGVVGLGLLVPPLQEARAATPMAIAACSAQLLDERQLFVARESGAALRVDAAARLSFAPASAQQLNHGLRAGGLWLRFRQAPEIACADPMFVSLGNLFSNRVEVYRRAQGADWALHWSSMRTQEEGGRPRLRQAAFPLDPEALEPIEYLVRVSGPAPLLLAPSVVTGTGMADQTGDRLLLGGLLTGGILALALHCAVLARVSGLSGLFAFSASAVALAVFYGISSGVLDRGLLWLADSAADPDELAQRATSYSVAMAALFHWFFVRGLLTEDPAPPRPALHSALLLGWASMASVLPFVGIA